MPSVPSSTSQFMMLGVSHSASLRGLNTNAILKTAQGNLLVDCGHTVKLALHEQALSFHDIDAVFITHVHGDHVFGLERLAFETRFDLKKRVRLFLEPQLYTELWDQTLKGSLGFVNGKPQRLDDYFDVQFIEGGAFEFDIHQVKTIQVDHAIGKPAFGFVIDNYLFYSGDTRPIPEQIAQLQFEVGFHDSTLLETSPVHANLSSLANLYHPDICKRLYLMGYEEVASGAALPGLDLFRGLAKVGESISLPILVTS